MSPVDILLDAPALHSLKRAQLVQLCKRHGVKASGKNAVLVERLTRHAAGLLATPARPRAGDGRASDSDEDSDDDAKDEDKEGDRTMQQRSSETWEIVMDNSDILEEQYSGSVQSKTRLGPSLSQGQMGEFGSTGSSKSKVMQVLANSLGLSRSTSSNSNPFVSTSNEIGTNTFDRVASLKDSESTSSRLESSSPKKLNIFGSSDASSNYGAGTSSPVRDTLAALSVPYDAIPLAETSRLPHIEPFAFSIAGAADTSLGDEEGLDLLVPGVGPLASTGVEASGISGSGSGTIRLITKPFDSTRLAQEGLDTEPPALAPFKPAFELVPPTPSNPLKSWPLSPEKPGEDRPLYPSLTFEDLDASSGGVPTSPSPVDKKATTEYESDVNPAALLSPPPQPSTPFVFGSPNPRHSSTAGDFVQTAESVLAEMNARLGITGARTLDTGILASVGVKTQLTTADVLNYQFGGKEGLVGAATKMGGEGSVSSRFDAMHERVFNKMEGIDNYAARRAVGMGNADAASASELAPLEGNRKRKSYVPAASTNKRRSTHAHVRVVSTKKVGMPGAFGDDDADGVDADLSGSKDAEEAPEREAKRACVEASGGDGQMKRVSIAPGARRETKTQAQSEADRRHLALNKARRRSSRARIGVAPAAATQKPKGRLGFLASAKSFVKSVWNHGAGNPAAAKVKGVPAPPAAGPSSKPAEAPAAKPPKPPIPDAKKPVFARQTSTTARKVSAQQPPALPPKAPESSNGDKGNSKAPAGDAPSDSAARKPSSSVTSSTAARSRLFAPTASSLAKINANARNKTNAQPSSASTKPLATRTRASAAPASRIPTVSPLMPRKKNHSTAASATSPRSPTVGAGEKPGIFSSPLVLPTSPQARKAAEQGQSVNAITGTILLASVMDADAGMPSLMAMADSLLTEVQEQEELTTEKDEEEEQEKGELGERTGEEDNQSESAPSLLRKPRISRSKIIAKLGAQRERVVSTAGSDGSARPPLRSGAPSANAKTNLGSGAATNANAKTKALRSPAKKSLPAPAKTTGVRGTKTKATVLSPKGAAAARVRKSAASVATTSSTAARRSVGTAKARAGGAVMLSAKKRVRESEYARRRSTKAPVPQPDFDTQEVVEAGADDMDIDDY